MDELVKHQLETHEKRINNHSERLDRLEQEQSEFRANIGNLIQKVDSLINTLKWLIGLVGSGLIGFFFYMLQKLLER